VGLDAGDATGARGADFHVVTVSTAIEANKTAGASARPSAMQRGE